ncbi:hypothetical protein LOTGIDRAFT_159155 [Lottia gigantea]|uniref:FAM69 N-terminal domain-containing protein n=1 Tax=Lottia gigantea TaxID=225164 RepID=V4AMI7_LOTGI|nr:hypothetical protein LOTGIDRAFT_159155 [Lottia gigantea]ESO98352.1 hypothetical protein LOTGIDRAFT_159155 [Lottia gigantea]
MNWSCCYRYRRRKIWLFCSSFGCCFLIWFLWNLTFAVYDRHCSETDSKDLLEVTCDWYHKGFIIGDLCPALCERKQIKYEHCTNYKSGKTVLVMSCNNLCSAEETVPAILKSHFPNIEKFQEKFMGPDNMMSTTLVEFRFMIEEMIYSSLGLNFSNSGDVIQKVFEYEYDHYLNPLDDKKYKAFILSVWSLVNQDEYLITKLHQHSPLFPKIYHSCGSFYLMEFAPPGSVLNPPVSLFTSYSGSWEERVKIALKLLDSVLNMESTFHEPIHMCDVKGENFGIGLDGRIKLIDTDSVFFESKLLQDFATTEKCSSDKDCNFWDCHGLCSEGVCLKQRLNNNLQSICEDVFLPSLPIFNNGLLRNPPDHIKQELSEILQLCTAPFYDNMDEKISKKTYWKLYNLLQYTVD